MSEPGDERMEEYRYWLNKRNEAADAHKSSDSMDEEVLRQLCLDLWDFINNHDRVTITPDHDGFYAGLRERVIEALNLDE